MPADLGLIIANLTSFYDLRRKVVIHVGADGGQLLGYAPLSLKVIAVDKDPSAIRRLEERIPEQSLGETVSVVPGDFRNLDLHGDVVLLEFCLHEMSEPRSAIEHARSIAADVLVIDHLPESRWAWYANEDEAMARAWKAVAAAGPRERRSYEAVQRFGDYRELEERFSSLGEESHRRIRALREQPAVVIPMPYGIALV